MWTMNKWGASSAQIALMRIAPENDTSTIVLVGSLNPAIFHPAWFALNEIVGKEEINDAKIDVVHKEVSRFVVRGIEISKIWFQFVSEIFYPIHQCGPWGSIDQFILSVRVRQYATLWDINWHL